MRLNFTLLLVYGMLLTHTLIPVNAEIQHKFDLGIKDAPQRSPINIKSLLEICLEQHPLVRIANEDLRVSKIKYEDVAKKKFLYTLKLVNASALENALEHEVQIYIHAKENIKSNVVAETTKKYYKLIEALMMKKLADQMEERAKTQVKTTAMLVTEGKSIKLDLDQSEIYLMDAEQKVLEAEAAYYIASTDLINYAHINTNNTLIIPEEYNLQDNHVIITPLQLISISSEEDIKAFVSYAIDHRYDIKQQLNRIEYLKHIKNTVGLDRLKIEEVKSNKVKEEIKLDMLKENVPVMVNSAILTLEVNKNKIETSQKELELASKTVEKVTISYNERYATLKDLQDAHVNFVDKKGKHIQAIIDYNNAQIELLRHLGAISAKSIIHNEPFKLTQS